MELHAAWVSAVLPHQPERQSFKNTREGKAAKGNGPAIITCLPGATICKLGSAPNFPEVSPWKEKKATKINQLSKSRSTIPLQTEAPACSSSLQCYLRLVSLQRVLDGVTDHTVTLGSSQSPPQLRESEATGRGKGPMAHIEKKILWFTPQAFRINSPGRGFGTSGGWCFPKVPSPDLLPQALLTVLCPCSCPVVSLVPFP